MKASTSVSPRGPDGLIGSKGYSMKDLAPSNWIGNQSFSWGSVSREASRKILPVKSSNCQTIVCSPSFIPVKPSAIGGREPTYEQVRLAVEESRKNFDF